MFVAALDLGTTGCRTFIFDMTGTIISSAYQEWESFYPVPSYVEQDANSWWESLKNTIEIAIKKSGIDKSEIVSLSIANFKKLSKFTHNTKKKKNLIAMDLLVEVISFAAWFFVAVIYLICLKEVKIFLIISHLYEIEVLRFLINLGTVLVFLPGLILFALILIHLFFG